MSEKIRDARKVGSLPYRGYTIYVWKIWNGQAYIATIETKNGQTYWGGSRETSQEVVEEMKKAIDNGTAERVNSFYDPIRESSLSREREILAKLDKLRKEISVLQATPSKDAWVNYKNIQSKYNEITKLEKELRQDDSATMEELANKAQLEFLGKSQPPPIQPVAHAGLSADDWKRIRNKERKRKLMKPIHKFFQGYEETAKRKGKRRGK